MCDPILIAGWGAGILLFFVVFIPREALCAPSIHEGPYKLSHCIRLDYF